MRNHHQHPSPLPMREGVASSYYYLQNLPRHRGLKLLDFLCEHFHHISRDIWLSRMANREVVWENGQYIDADTLYQAGRCIFYYRHVEKETPIPFQEVLIYQDEHILVVDKPPFLPVTPSGHYLQETLLTRLRRHPMLEHLPLEQLTPLHRLDKDTQGLILFSINPTTRRLYQQLFGYRKIHKRYQAIVHLPKQGLPPLSLTHQSRIVNDERFFLSREVAGVANSVTHIQQKLFGQHTAQYELTPLTGKKHQLRLHLSQLGMPIVFDTLYPVAHKNRLPNFLQPLQLLAKSLCFRDPLQDKLHYFESGRHLLHPW